MVKASSAPTLSPPPAGINVWRYLTRQGEGRVGFDVRSQTPPPLLGLHFLEDAVEQFEQDLLDRLLVRRDTR